MVVTDIGRTYFRHFLNHIHIAQKNTQAIIKVFPFIKYKMSYDGEASPGTEVIMFIVSLLLALTLNANGGNLDAATLTDVNGFIDGEPYNFIAKKTPFRDDNGRSILLDPEAADSLISMMVAAFYDGQNIRINYGFRDNNTQKKLYKHRRYRHLVAKPGWSVHQSGLAIDIAGCVRKKHKTQLYWWLIKNGAQFGFYNTIKSEPWHFEYRATAVNNNIG